MKRLLLVLVLTGLAWGQPAPTKTKKVKSGTTAPASCGPGDVFFKTDATAGQNLYGCTSANTWTLLNTGSAPVVGTFNTTAGTCATTGGGSCTASDTCGTDSLPCVAITHNFGTPIKWPECESGAASSVMYGGASAAVSVYDVISTSSNTITTITLSAAASGKCGVSTGNSGPKGDKGDTGAAGSVAVVASGTATLGTGAIGANACASAVTVSATGTATTDVIFWTPNADISGVTGYGKASTDGLIVYPYPTADNVNFKVCNATGTSITPGAVTLNWKVFR